MFPPTSVSGKMTYLGGGQNDIHMSFCPNAGKMTFGQNDIRVPLCPLFILRK